MKHPFGERSWLYIAHGNRILHVWFGRVGFHIHLPDFWRSEFDVSEGR